MEVKNFVSDPKEFKCEIVLSRNITTLGLGWEGIPTNLVINSFIFILMTLLFFCLRRKAWNRKTLHMTRTRKGWLYFIYGNRETRKKVETVPIATDHHVHDNEIYSRILLPPTANLISNKDWEGNVVTIEMQNDNDLNNDVSSTLQTRKKLHSNHIGDNSSTNDESKEETSLSKKKVKTTFARSMSSTEFGYWLFDILCIRDKDILNDKGSDAVQYLLFQQYLIYYLILLTLVCMIVVLPVNLMGNTEPNTKPFGRTTISNTLSNPNLLWCHVIISVILLAFGFFLMCHFSKTLKADEAKEVKRTLCICRIPKSKRNKEKLYEHFQQMFPDAVIEGIQFVYNTKRLKAVYAEYNSMINAKYYCQEYLNEFHDRCEVYPYFLGHWGSNMICCNCYKVDGLTYYENRELELERDVEKEFRDCISNPSGSVFVTLKTEQMAQKVYTTLRKNQEKSCGIFPCNFCFRFGTWLRKLIGNPNEDEFETYRWLVSYASYPDDINWDDIAVDYKLIWMRRIIINLFLFLIFFFLSTPSIVISILDVLQIESTLRLGLEYVFFRHSQFATEYLSPLLMVIASIILPSFVILASQYLPYKTLSDLNHSIMWKVFLFLIMMVIILPSLGLSSAQALLSSITNSSDKKFRWECLFPVDNGAFFVNYVLQSTLLSNALELLRFPELFLYLFYYIFCAKTPAEYDKARQQVIFDFQFGIRYPRFLLILCMVVTYSLSCPLIAPCGLLYMVIKHIVDRYNIYYVYTPSKINGRIHSTAITFFHIGILMMVFQIFTFAFLKNSQSDQSKILMIVVIVASIVFSGHCFYHCFWNINHLTYSATLRRVSKPTQTKEFCACTYLPSVLFDLNLNGIVPPDSPAQKKYGSVSSCPTNEPIRSSDSNQRLNISTLGV